MMGMRRRKCIALVLIGIAFLSYAFAWFKQYTYFLYSGAEEDIYDPRLQQSAEDVAEKEYEPDPAYGEKLSRILFWVAKYSDVTIANENEEPVRVILYDYRGEDVEAMNAPVILESGAERSFATNEQNGYVLTVYGERADQRIDGVRVSHSNAGYMNRGKTAMLFFMIGIAAVTALSFLWVLLEGRSYRTVAPYLYLASGAAGVLYMVYVRWKGLENWHYILPQMGSVFAAIMTILSAAESEEKKDSDRQKVAWPRFWGIVALLGVLLVQFLMLTSRPGSVWYIFNGSLESKRRILGYAVVVLFFLLLYLSLGHIKISRKITLEWKAVFAGKFVRPAFVLLLLALGEKWIFTNPLGILLTVLLFAAFKYGGKIQIPGCVYGAFAVVITVVVALNRCVINIWDTGAWGDTYHASAFYNSLLPVAENHPFESGMNELYGHYALFYKIPMLIFGNNMRTVGITTAFFSGVTVLAALLAFRKLIKKDLLKVIAGLVLFVCMVSDELYVMTFPLRELWSFVLLAYSAYMQPGRITPRSKRIGYLICVLAILWNPESGVVGLICWSLYVVFRSQEYVDIRQSVVLFLKEGGYLVGTVLGAYLLVKAYNIAMAPGTDVWRELTDWHKEMGIVAKYDTGDTSDGKLYWGNEAWLYIELLLFMIAARVVERLGVFDRRRYEPSDNTETLFLIYSIGIFAYWMNRPEEYDIITPYIGCLLVIEADRLLVRNEEQKGRGKPVEWLIAFCLFFGIASMLSQVPATIKNASENLGEKGILDYASVCSYMDNFEKEVPEDAYIEAIGGSMISMTLGRDLKGDARAETDEEQLISNTEGEEWVLTGSPRTRLPEGTLYKEIPFGKFTYYLYRQKAAE